MPKRSLTLLIAPFVPILFITYVNACGQSSDCVIENRTYRVFLPETFSKDRPTGAIIFLHGYRGTAKGTMRNKSLISLATKIGIPLIAPQSDGRDWNTPGAPGFDTKRNNAELDYFDNIIQDITKRFNIDRNKLLLSGFSSGGMTVWHLACNRGKSFAAFVPFSGTYWHPVPESCPTGPVHLFHTHGTKDSVVPLGGRPIGTTHQGNVKVAIERMASLGQYFSTDIKNPNGLNCSRQKNDQNKILELCLFSGGHSMKVSQIERVWYEIGLN